MAYFKCSTFRQFATATTQFKAPAAAKGTTDKKIVKKQPRKLTQQEKAASLSMLEKMTDVEVN